MKLRKIDQKEATAISQLIGWCATFAILVLMWPHVVAEMETVVEMILGVTFVVVLVAFWILTIDIMVLLANKVSNWVHSGWNFMVGRLDERSGSNSANGKTAG